MTALLTNFFMKLIGSNGNNFEHRKNRDFQQTCGGDDEFWAEGYSLDCWDPDI